MSDDHDPYALKPGFDYHLAEVHPVVSSSPQGGQAFYAGCRACGWRGETRGSRGLANDDAYTHDVTHNE